MRRPTVIVAGIAATTLAVSLSLPAAATTDQPGLPDDIADLLLDDPLESTAVVDPALAASGVRTVNIQLAAPAVAEVAADGADAAEQQQRGAEIAAEQADLVADLQDLDPAATAVAQVDTALNSVVVEADAAAVREIAEDPRVESVSVVQHYTTDDEETTPYIGASAVQAAGVDGTGVTVAVLDSGIDYTHAAFGGPGTPEAYAACYGTGPTPLGQPFDLPPTPECAASFGPGARVVTGFDFVGEAWPQGARTEDPNPIDFEGHGTHVADIVGGPTGVAPGVDLVAIKVCSAISSSCNGISLLRGVDFALDPDQDGITDDAVDVMNMSLGNDYNLAFDDDLAAAVDAASELGVLTVASAGNGGDKPFVNGTPAGARSAVSVAQTDVPSATIQFFTDASGGSYTGLRQAWSAPLTASVTAPVVYGDGAGGNLTGCQPFAPGTFAGQAVLVDRGGGCAFSVKNSNIAAAGGSVGLFGLIAPGTPFPASSGGGDSAGAIPGFMVSQADADAIRAGLPTTLTLDPAEAAPTVGTVTGSSSRGPAMSGQGIKPEIGAPGASVSAVAGTGTGAEPFSGTSGAAPMVAGSAALLLQAQPDYGPAELKAVLMNTAETEIYNTPRAAGGDLAPVSRIGAGEVRVDAAVAATASAFASDTGTAGFSFGLYESTRRTGISRTVEVTNHLETPQTFTVTPSFRFADDEASGAIRLVTVPRVRVEPGQSETLTLTLRIDPTRLPDWTLDSGVDGASGDVLTAMEFDGYVTLTSADGTLSLPWHVIPRKAGNLEDLGAGSFRNVSRAPAATEVYGLLGTSPDLPAGGRGEQAPTPDLKYAGYTSVPVEAGICDAERPSSLLRLAVSTWERQTHADSPASVRFLVDTTGDGIDDYEVFSFDRAGTATTDGRNVVFVTDLRQPPPRVSTSRFFTDHDTMSANTVLTVCAEQLGLDGEDTSTTIRVTPRIADIEFTGLVTDAMAPVTFAPFDTETLPTVGGDAYGTSVAPGRRTQVEAGPSGALLLVRDGTPGLEAFAVGDQG
jgi:subtilisin family serine protease